MRWMTRCVSRALLLLSPLAWGATAPAAAAQWTLLGPAATQPVAVRSVDAFAEAVARSTAGRVTLVPGAQGNGVVAALASSRAAVGVFPLALLESQDPVLALDRVPYLLTNFVQARKLWEVLRPEVERALEAHGLVLLYAVPSPPPAPVSRLPLTTVAAWRGRRLLVSAPAMELLSRALGAQPVTGGDMAAALGGGKADIALASAVSAADAAAWDYADNFLDAPAWFPKQLVVVNRRVLSALEAGQREVVLAAARDAAEQAWALSQQSTAEGVQRLRDRGVKMAQPSVALLIQLEAVGRELLFRWSDAAGEAGARLVEAYFAVR